MSVTSFANILSQSVGFLFILFFVFFAVQNLLSRPICAFLFLFPLFGETDKKDIATFMLKIVLLMFSSRSVIVSGLGL